jgi:ATP/maltotriose-dependent transcriptional regulator MalT
LLDERAGPVLERARDALIGAESTSRAAEACALLAEHWWNSGQRERVSRHLEQALELVADEGPSVSKAWVLSQVSRYEMLAGEHGNAVRVGREALAMAETLGLDEVRAHVLNNIGTARCADGDAGGIEDLERSIEIANAIDSPELARAYNNLATVVAYLGHVQRNLELRRAAVQAGERLGAWSTARFAATAQTMWEYALGNWEVFDAESRSMLEESERLGGRYQDAYMLSTRALVAVARAEDADARASSQRALELARGAGDPQIVLPVLAEVAFVEVELGRLEIARQHGKEFVSGPRYVSGGQRADSTFALVARDLQLESELRASLEATRAEDRWGPPVHAVLDGDYLGAAEMFGEMGLRTLEAHARLRAGEQLLAAGRQSDAEKQLERSLAFWRSVGATRYVRRGESLLGKSATERTSGDL